MTWQRDILEPDNLKLNVSRNFRLPHSPGVKAGPLIYLSGMVAIDPETGDFRPGTAASEARQIFENMRHLLASHGVPLARVVKLNVFLADIAELDSVDEVCREFFPADPPARTTCGVQLSRGLKVEIECVALAAT